RLGAAVLMLAVTGCGDETGRAGSEAGAALAGKLDQAALTARVLSDKARTMGFAVTGTRYGYDAHPQTGQRRPYLDIEFHNESQLDIERLWVQASLRSNGGAWLTQVFNFPVSGGLAAGADGSARVTPPRGAEGARQAQPHGGPANR